MVAFLQKRMDAKQPVLVLCDRGLRALAQHLAGNAEDVDVPA